MLFQDEELGAYAKHLTTQAKVPHKWAFVHDHVGYNYRMPNINAALGCAQLEEIDFILGNKRATAWAYQAFFKDMDGMSFVSEPVNARSNYWLNAVLLNDRGDCDTPGMGADEQVAHVRELPMRKSGHGRGRRSATCQSAKRC